MRKKSAEKDEKLQSNVHDGVLGLRPVKGVICKRVFHSNCSNFAELVNIITTGATFIIVVCTMQDMLFVIMPIVPH